MQMNSVLQRCRSRTGLIDTISRRKTYDNAMAENFFFILKTECIYRHKPKTFKEANDLIDRYIHFYNYERIQIKVMTTPKRGGMTIGL